MDSLPFVKMHGAGNDYVFVDLFDDASGCRFPDAAEDAADLARRVSCRRTGIGSDGLVLMLPGEGAADAEMRMFNADGSPSGMCGNALRCLAAWLHVRRGLPRRMHVLTGGRTIEAFVLSDDAGDLLNDARPVDVSVDLGNPVLTPPDIPVASRNECCIEEAVSEFPDVRMTCLSVGNPHGVIFVPSLDHAPVASLGAALEVHSMFPERANIGFAEVVDRSRIRLRVWERGSGETAACGSGACAAAVAGVLTERTSRRVAIEMPGGELQVEWTADNRIVLTGPAQISFEGTYFR